jgi:hypothetical protein
MDAYRRGATERLAAFANKKYRCLPASWFDDINNEHYAAFGEVAADSMNLDTRDCIVMRLFLIFYLDTALNTAW